MPWTQSSLLPYFNEKRVVIVLWRIVYLRNEESQVSDGVWVAGLPGGLCVTSQNGKWRQDRRR